MTELDHRKPRLVEGDTTTPEWFTHAACSGMDPDWWFPERGHTGTRAKRVCATCTVRTQCLEYAIANGERHGIWGGCDREGLVAIRKARQRGAA